MLPFPRIILLLRCHPEMHDQYFDDDFVGFPVNQWSGPREVICAKHGKSGKKYLFKNGVPDDRSTLSMMLQAALSSLEPVRKDIVPNVLGGRESTTIQLLLSANDPIRFLIAPTVLAHVASFGMQLEIAVPEPPLSASEREEMIAEAKKMGITDFEVTEEDDWEY